MNQTPSKENFPKPKPIDAQSETVKLIRTKLSELGYKSQADIPTIETELINLLEKLNTATGLSLSISSFSLTFNLIFEQEE